VVQVFDVHRTSEGRPFLVCEFLEGVELAEHIQHEGKVSIAFAIRVTRQLCKALAAAHALGIVHRDMKPENVFLTGPISAPIAKVIDFGISKTGDTPGTQLTKTGMIMGTPSFMAPEQAKGLKVSHHCDIYAVGAILYNMVTGQRPFDRNDPTATLTAVLIEDPPRPRSLEPSISENLEAVIQRAMSKESGDRHANMTELDAALAPFDTTGGAGESLRPPMPGLPGAAATAGTLMGGAGLGLRDRAAGLARPTIMLMVGLGFFAASGFVMTLITSLVRISRGGDAKANLSGAEAAVLSLVVIVALVAPVVLAVKHFKSTVWGNTARAVDTAARLKGPVMTALAAYGGASLLVRIIETVMLRRPIGAAWPTWDLLMVLIAVAAAGGYALVLRMESRRAN